MTAPSPEKLVVPALAPLRTLNLPPSSYANLAWVNQGIIIEYDPTGRYSAISTQLALIQADNSTLEILPLEADPQCSGQSGFEHPLRLPDGTLGYVARCVPASNAENALSLWRYDMDTGQAQPLRQTPFPHFGIARGEYTYSPAMDRALGTEGSPFDSQAYWFDETEVQPIDLGLGIVASVSWSPDGTQIALIGAEQAVSRPENLNILFNLYTLDPATLKRTLLVRGFRNSSTVEWSPDGQWIVFQGDYRDADGHVGLWAYHLPSQTRRLIAEGDYKSPSWSPSGDSIAAVRTVPSTNGEVREEVVILDVRALQP